MTKKPSYRFVGYTEPWVEKKLGEVVDVNSGKDYKHLSKGEIPVYGTGGYMLSVSESLSDADGIGIGRKGTIDKPYILKAPFWTVDTLFYCIPRDAYNLYFVYSIFNNVTWKKFDESTGVPSLSKITINNIQSSFPSLPEQTAIGSFFQDIDQLISLQQRKLEVLKEQKKTYLKLLFPAKGQTKPALRFAGFEDEWKEVKLGEVTERITRKNKHLESTLPLTISAQYGLIDQETFFNKKVASKDVSGYYLLKRGEFAYNKSYSSEYPWGAVKRLDNYEKGVLSPLYIVFKPKFIDSDFLAVYYASSNWHKEVSMRASEGARNHGLLNISPQDFFDTELIVPISSAEQEAIGSFFQDLDKAIAKQEEKVNQLKESKQTLLRKMFI
jgi:type I site-specific deoxyribonuclease specificity subunit (fragment)